MIAPASTDHNQDRIPFTKTSVHEVLADLPDAAWAGELYWLLEFASGQMENSRNRLCELLDVDWTVISRVYQGKYPSVGSFATKVKRLREDVEKFGFVPFVSTIVSDRMFALFDYLRSGDSRGGFMGKVQSPAGRGKTEGGKEYVRLHPEEACYFKVNPSGGFTGMQKDMARAMGIGEDRADKRSLKQKIIDRANRNLLIIIDEASLLLPSGTKNAVRELEFIRHLHDAKRAPIALLVTKVWDDQSTSPKLAAWLEQFNRRLQDSLVIPTEVWKATEVEPIVRVFRKDPPANLVTLAHSIANNEDGKTPGRLEILFRLLINANMFARAKGEPLTAAHLLAARDFRANRNRWPKSGE